MKAVQTTPNTPDVADLLSGAFAGHTMQRLRTPDGRYRYSYVSVGAREGLGLDPEALMAMEAVDHAWIHDEDRGRFLQALETSAAALTRLDEEVRVADSKGGYRWVRSIGSPRRLDDGTTIWDGVALDVTDRHEALLALNKTLSQVRANETSEARFSYIAAADVSNSLSALEAAISGLEATEESAKHVKKRFAAFKKTLSAARDLVNPGEAQELDAPPNAHRPIPALTDKQRDVLERLTTGESNRQIAQRLGITEGTVKLHISAALKRLGAKNRTEAAMIWNSLR
jgi:PAS domain S-box-containing protein